MIRIENISHSLGRSKVLNDVCLNVPDGSILGLIGINGAGKSTLLRILAGVYQPDKGQVTYDGASPLLESTRRNIFFLPDDPYFTAQTTCRSMARMYRVFYPELNITEFEKMISGFGLDPKKPLRTFSKGMRRQAYIALALTVRPKYLLLDEAFDGLDPLARQTVKNALIELVEGEDPSTVIISSHALREIEEFCDKFALLDHLTVTSSGELAEKVNDYCLFRLAFVGGVPENAFDGLPVVSVTGSGKFVKVMLQAPAADMAEKLEALHPDVMEELPVNFEEVFISGMHGANSGKEEN